MSVLGFRTLGELLIGENPLDVARLWDKLYIGSAYYGRRGIAMQCISAIDKCWWSIRAQAAGVALCEEVWVPTRSSQMGLMVRAMLRSGVSHGRHGGQEFRYASPDADPRLSRSQQVELEGMRLEQVLPAAPGHTG